MAPVDEFSFDVEKLNRAFAVMTGIGQDQLQMVGQSELTSYLINRRTDLIN